LSLRHESDGTIVLYGSCTVDEAEPLQRMLLSDLSADVDWTQCTHLHTAIVQLLLVARRGISKPCGDPFVDRWICGNLHNDDVSC
jgi:hypothetical protein